MSAFRRVIYIRNISEKYNFLNQKNLNVNFKNYSSNSIHEAVMNARGGKIMSKLINSSKKKKSISYKNDNASILKEISLLSSRSNEVSQTNQQIKIPSHSPPPPSVKNRRRVEVINDILMEHITSLLATGEVAKSIQGLGLQISKVKVANKLNVVNIYWVTSGTEKDALIEKLLEQVAKHLRHELISHHVLGVVPPLQFVKDSTYSKIMDVEKILANLDFGPDYTPSDIGSRLKENNNPSKSVLELKSESEITENILEKIEQLENKKDVNLWRNDIYGVDHDFLMSKVLKGVEKEKEKKLKKQRSIIENESLGESESYRANLDETSSDLISDLETDNETRAVNIAKFLKMRKIAIQKAKKRADSSSSSQEIEIFRQEQDERWNEKQQDFLKFFDEVEKDDKDKEDFYEEEEVQVTFDEYRKS